MTVDQRIAQEILQAAHEAVKGAELPSNLEVAAFEKAVDLLAVQAGLAQAAPSAPSAPDGGGRGETPDPGAEKTIARIASELKLGPELVGEVFHTDGDELRLSPAPSRFETARTAATKQIALLVAAGRQAGAWDAEWTSSAEIRTVCSDYGKLDSSNFAATLTDMDDVFGFSGSGRSRKVKVNRTGYEEAAKLVRELAGEETP